MNTNDVNKERLRCNRNNLMLDDSKSFCLYISSKQKVCDKIGLLTHKLCPLLSEGFDMALWKILRQYNWQIMHRFKVSRTTNFSPQLVNWAKWYKEGKYLSRCRWQSNRISLTRIFNSLVWVSHRNIKQLLQ